MSDLAVKHMIVGAVATNCYLAMNTKTKEALIIDPGDSAKRIAEIIKEEGVTPVAVLLTHGHFDHAMAAEELAGEFQIPIYAHEKEQETLETPRINLSGMIGQSLIFHADNYVKDGDVLNLAGFEIKVLHTPGHTLGGVCYYLEKEKVLFSGDTLFCQSVGRTDFPTGSSSTLIRSIKEKLMPLADDINVYTGHEDMTTIGMERKYNPFL
ncbi:MAG: MBL fold metallo-hydrolase [Lachnospiraceae bacterium]